MNCADGFDSKDLNWKETEKEKTINHSIYTPFIYFSG
jgi:hypothetical protein